MRKIYYIVFLMLLSCAPSDEDSLLPSDVFVKYYGEGGIHTVKDIVSTPDGGYIILATQDVGSSLDFYFVLADAEGGLIWSGEKNINGDDDPARIKSIGDGEFLVIGTSTENVNGADSSRLVWGRFGIVNDSLNLTDDFHVFPYNGNLEGADIVVADASGTPGYILLGTSDKSENNGGGTDIFIHKVDEDNESVWTEPVIKGFTDDDKALAVFEKENGNLIIIGSTQVASAGFMGTNVLVYETNEFGSADIGAHYYGISGEGETPAKDGDEIPHAAIQTSSGFVIVGSTTVGGSRNSFLLNLNKSGVRTFETVLVSNDYGSQESEALGVTRLLTGDYMVVGWYPTFTLGTGEDAINKQSEMMMMRTDQFGERRPGYDQHYGTSVGNDKGNAVITAPDGDVVLAATVEYGSTLTMIGLMKLNSSGELKD